MKRVLLFLLISVASFLFSGNISAQAAKWLDEKYEVFLECLNVNNYDGAKAELIRLSDQGDPQASCCLAAMLCFGEKNDRDYAAALELLTNAAEKNYERAEYLLGSFGSMEKSREMVRLITGDDSMMDSTDTNFWKNCFKTDSDVETFQDVFKWFLLKDGNWGYRDIMYFSGIQYLNGSLGLHDEDKGLKWIFKAYELGYPDAVKLINEIMESIKGDNESE